MRLVYKKNKKIRLICAFCWAFFHWRDWRWHLDIKKGLHFGSHIQFFVLVSSGHLCENLLTAPRSACSCRPGSSNLAQPSRVGFSSQRHSGVCPLLPIRIGAWADHTPWRWTAGKAWFVGWAGGFNEWQIKRFASEVLWRHAAPIGPSRCTRFKVINADNLRPLGRLSNESTTRSVIQISTWTKKQNSKQWRATACGLFLSQGTCNRESISQRNAHCGRLPVFSKYFPQKAEEPNQRSGHKHMTRDQLQFSKIVLRHN